MRYLNYLTLYNEPFMAIKEGRKTVEMRLFDDKRSQISIGELIEFTNIDTKEKIVCFVDKIEIYKDFESLYKAIDKVKLGYKEDEEASYLDMLTYYPEERQKTYNAMAIYLRLLNENDHLYRRYLVDKLFNENDIKLAIFDLDGTLIDSTSLWADIDSSFFKRRNMEIPPEYNKEIAHIGLTAAARLTKEKYVPNEKEEDIIKEWNDLALEAYEKHIPLKDYALATLEELRIRGIIIALATANSEQLYLPCMKRLEIEPYFSIVEDVNNCKEGKNSPEIYDKIAHRFKLNRNQVVVFEDMITAEKTAFESGYLVIGVNDKNTVVNHLENRKYCHVFIESFYDVFAALFRNR